MTIGEFHNVQEIGQGGMGTVYQGYLGSRKVAIKEIRRDYMSEEDLVRRFRQEASILDQLDHPSVVKIVKPQHYEDRRYYPAFEHDGSLYIAMDFIEGLTLDKYIRANGGPLPENTVTGLMCRILDAMEYIRQKGLVHRDIKPSNIIIRPDGSVCIIDFGIAKDITSSGMTTGRCVLGTNGYMSPEQAEGGLTIDSRTDIYSLGCVLFFMVTGTHAVQKKASDMETRIAIIRDAFPRARDINPAVSERMESIINKAVDKNMLRRFQSPYEFKMELLNDPIRFQQTHVSMDGRPDCITIGRDPGCDVVIHDPTGKVSRQHLEISWDSRYDGTQYTFRDRSTNGTMINEVFIKGSSCSLLDPVITGPHCFCPVIILAGVTILDWREALSAITRKEAARQTLQPAGTEADTGHDTRSDREDGLFSSIGKLFSRLKNHRQDQTL